MLHCEKNVSDFPVPSRDVTYQTLPGRYRLLLSELTAGMFGWREATYRQRPQMLKPDCWMPACLAGGRPLTDRVHRCWSQTADCRHVWLAVGHLPTETTDAEARLLTAGMFGWREATYRQRPQMLKPDSCCLSGPPVWPPGGARYICRIAGCDVLLPHGIFWDFCEYVVWKCIWDY